jgi:adenine-specific DNA-methyltransferase
MTTTVIQPDENHNSLPANAKSENIYISGDNLDGLKHLLKSYNKEINCIYIDPPYNTGSDGFAYFDNFNYNKETLQEKLSVSEEEAVRILDLTKRGSASHSAWLMFMYCRLLLAKDLLTDDGVIFISIDDNENANLKLICDDVFGEENLINNVVINMNSLSGVKMTHAIKGKGYPAQKEYLLIYKQGTKTPLLKIEKKSKEEWDKEYTLIIPELDKEQFIGFENSTEQDVNAVLRSMRLISLVEYANEINIELTEDWKWENSYRIFGSKSNTSLVEKIKDKVFEQQVVCYTNSENNLRFFRSDFNKNTKDPRIELVNADANSAVFLSDNWVDISNDGGVAQEGGVIFPNGKKPLQLITRILRSIDHSNNTILDFSLVLPQQHMPLCYLMRNMVVTASLLRFNCLKF